MTKRAKQNDTNTQPAPDVSLSVRGLVEFVLRGGSIDSRFSGFDRAAQGSRIHRKLQKAAGGNYQAEVTLKASRTVDGLVYALEGRADGVIDTPDGLVVDEIKTTAAPAERITEDFNPLHWAQAKCYAAFLCEQRGLAGATVQLTYYQIDTDEILRFRRSFTAAELESFLLDTLRMYTKWARLRTDWQRERNASLQALTFPFAAYRDGQYRLAGATYKTIEAGGRLFACAPTGIGKTISTLFPACKAMGEGMGERIFYLTAKTITRAAAENALHLLRAQGMRLKSVTLTAKDKACLLEERACTPEHCTYADGYYDRVNDALYDFLQTRDTFTRDEIAAYATQRRLCPFEFALDLTLFCDCVVCDYNYLFDPVVYLKRFFEEGGDFVFLIDEAHNLVSRAREMYSAALDKSAFYEVKKALGKGSRKLTTALTKINAAFIELRHTLEDGEPPITEKADDNFARLLMQFSAAAEEWLEEHREDARHAQMLQLYFDVRFYLRIFELYDEHFATLRSVRGSAVRTELLCLDAAPFLDASMSKGRASVLFSATLLPADYFIATLGGGEQAKRTLLTSPFDASRLCLLTADTVSTKYADRADTLDAVCDLIETAVSAHRGNYIAFFPSYAYLRDAADRFAQRYPARDIVLQDSHMNEAAREDFLNRFEAQSERLCFCVLGGIFAEGVDLTGDRLVGTIIVGVGLPQVNPVQDALRDYYDNARGAGFDYAYRYPGMNKVLQAAGRVIRTEHDRGVALLIDTRYRQTGYRALFPPHWAHARSVKSAEEAGEVLRAFWREST